MLNKTKQRKHTNLDVPLFAHGIDHTALNWTPARSANRHAHLIMAGEAVEFTFQLASIGSQLLTVKHTTYNSHHFQQMDTADEITWCRTDLQLLQLKWSGW